MHRLYQTANALTGDVIGAAVEVHRVLGPGLLESIYERCLLRELEIRGLPAVNQEKIVIEYKGLRFEESLRFDVLVNSSLLVEVKAVEHVLPVHKAILMSYMKLLDIPLGLLINFHEAKLVDGVNRLILPSASHPD